MVKYFKYQRGIRDGVVCDINLYRFTSEIKHVAEDIVRVDSSDAMIAEWLEMQNCNPVELSVDESSAVEKALVKTNGEDYDGYMIPFTNDDAIGMLQVKAAFEMGVTATNIEFSNGTIMPMSAADFPVFSAWFVAKRNGYFV